MKSKRCRFGAVALKGRLYVVGGDDGRSDLNTVECYDPDIGTWETVAPMKVMSYYLDKKVINF